MAVNKLELTSMIVIGFISFGLIAMGMMQAIDPLECEVCEDCDCEVCEDCVEYTILPHTPLTNISLLFLEDASITRNIEGVDMWENAPEANTTLLLNEDSENYCFYTSFRIVGDFFNGSVEFVDNETSHSAIVRIWNATLDGEDIVPDSEIYSESGNGQDSVEFSELLVENTYDNFFFICANITDIYSATDVLEIQCFLENTEDTFSYLEAPNGDFYPNDDPIIIGMFGAIKNLHLSIMGFYDQFQLMSNITEYYWVNFGASILFEQNIVDQEVLFSQLSLGVADADVLGEEITEPPSITKGVEYNYQINSTQNLQFGDYIEYVAVTGENMEGVWCSKMMGALYAMTFDPSVMTQWINGIPSNGSVLLEKGMNHTIVVGNIDLYKSFPMTEMDSFAPTIDAHIQITINSVPYTFVQTIMDLDFMIQMGLFED